MNPTPSESAPALPPNAARWFAEEVEPHEFRLRVWLAGRFPQLRDIDDVIQDAYVRLFRARTQGPIRSVQAFLFTAARNAALDMFRRQKSCPADYLEDGSGATLVQEGPDAAESVAAKQELELLGEAIRRLPQRCRQVFTLRKIYGLSQREVAAHLGISEHTVEVQMGKGARRCAEFLREKGINR